MSLRTTFAVERREAVLPTPAAKLSNGNGAARPPRFSPNEIIERIREWTLLYGEPPTIRDWDPSRARRTGQIWRAERFEAGVWPSIGMVKRQFGTFNAAVQAAGLPPRQGPRRIRRHLTGPEQVTAAIVEWTKRYGEPPTQADWDTVRARRCGQVWRIVRYGSGDWPSLNSVLYHFGSLGEAIQAAGLEPRQAGDPRPAVTEWRARNLRAVSEMDADRTSPCSGRALAQQVRAVARARRSADPQRLRMALLGVASIAIRWASDIAWNGD
jgi:Homing endonuclease associated repeat